MKAFFSKDRVTCFPARTEPDDFRVFCEVLILFLLAVSISATAFYLLFGLFLHFVLL